ncbi:MAG: CBS domain-containing protein [Saprospirales bacterium]|nr:CBS domain-containing protein [Saprospirales bacterium]
MNLIAPVSTIMTKNVIAVTPEDDLMKVKEIFDNYNIHHLPVVKYKQLVGIISKTDFLHFLHGFKGNDVDKFLDETRLKAWKAEEIMTKGLAKVDSEEPIRTILDVFLINRFHAVPIVDKNDELVGIVTTYDIIKALAAEPITLEDYKKAKSPQ